MNISPRSKRWIVCTSVTALGVVMVVIGVNFYLAASTAWQAEKTLHAIALVTAVVDRFVQQEQRWPRSWEELKSIECSDATAMYSLPDDADAIKRLVDIDFETDVRAIVAQGVDDFDAVKPTGPYYSYRQYGFVDELIESANSATESQK